MEPQVERSIVDHLEQDNMVVRVIDPKSEEMGDGVFRSAGVVGDGWAAGLVVCAGGHPCSNCPPASLSIRPCLNQPALLPALLRPARPVPRCRFKAEIQWSGEHVVQKYLGGLGRDSVYRQIRAAACTLDLPQEVMQDAIDTAMMEFGEWQGLRQRGLRQRAPPGQREMQLREAEGRAGV